MSSGMRDAYAGRMFGAQKGHVVGESETPLIVTRLQYGSTRDGLRKISAEDCALLLKMIRPTEGGEDGGC